MKNLTPLLLNFISCHILNVNPEFFARILFSQIALKDIFVTLKIHDYGMIYIYRHDRVVSAFREYLIFTKLRKFRENKTLAKNSEFTVWKLLNISSDNIFRSQSHLAEILFDFNLYVHSTIFQLCRDGSSWVEPVLS